MKKNMVFHLPLPVNPQGKSGSQVRPYEMLMAFRSIGYDVTMVTGYGAERARMIAEIKRDVKEGKRFDFLYSESSTVPTLLTEPHHLPTHPFLDFGFLRWAKRNSIKTGLFYRDIYWKFELYKDQVPLAKRVVTIPLYWYDWMFYRQVVDHLFLPSMLMNEYLPTRWPSGCLSTLPPGCKANKADSLKRRTGGLQLLYVGGVKPPLYDLTPTFEMMSFLNQYNIRLTICCREEEWEAVRDVYSDLIHNVNVKIVHHSADELSKLYEQVDIVLILRRGAQYLDFAFPVKVVESIGYNVPIITMFGTEAARFVEKEGLGWVVHSVHEAKGLLLHLLDNPQLVNQKEEYIAGARLRHTWKARAEQVADTLTS